MTVFAVLLEMMGRIVAFREQTMSNPTSTKSAAGPLSQRVASNQRLKLASAKTQVETEPVRPAETLDKLRIEEKGVRTLLARFRVPPRQVGPSAADGLAPGLNRVGSDFATRKLPRPTVETTHATFKAVLDADLRQGRA